MFCRFICSAASFTVAVFTAVTGVWPAMMERIERIGMGAGGTRAPRCHY